jgi:hypothetical protein
MALPYFRARLGGAVMLVALLHGVPAAAQDTPPDPATKGQHVEKLNDEGAAAYHARDYRRANEKFQQAYALDPDPNILYNIAKTYELLGDDSAALEKFELFVSQPGADPAGKTKANAKIQEIKARIAGAPKATATPSTPPPVGEQRFVVPTVVALGVGVVGAGVGTFFGLKALGTQSDLDSVCKEKSCPPTANDDISSLKTASTISTVGFIVGGVGLVSAAVLYIAGRPSSKKESASGLRITPTAGPTSVGFVGTF